MSQTETLDQVAFLVAQRLLKLFTYEETEPQREPVAFIAAVPRDLLAGRGAQITAGQDTPEWYLITDEGNGQWDEELREHYGVLVVHADDLSKARERLIATLAGREDQSGAASPQPTVLVGGAVRPKLERPQSVCA